MDEPFIAPVPPAQPAKPLTTTAPQKPVASQALLQPPPQAHPLVLTPRRTSSDSGCQDLPEEPEGNAPNRSGTLVTELVLSLHVARIAFVTPQGPPIRGDVLTDLVAGCYSLKLNRGADRARQFWMFDPGQVKSGRRFCVALDGARPDDLQYAETLLLSVVPGLTESGPNARAAVCKAIAAAVADHDPARYVDAYELLGNLNDADLYDVLEELDGTGVIGELLLHFETVLKTQPDGMSRLLRAFESFEVNPKQLYIDAFDQCYVHPKSFSKDPEREKPGLTSIRLVFTYNLTPARAIIVLADVISDSERTPSEPPRYGEGQLLYPQWASKGSTPRMWDAKQKLVAEIHAQNFAFFKAAFDAVESTIGLVMMAHALLTLTIPQATAPVAPRRGLSRPVRDAYQSQPGRFEPDPEAGTNMSEVDAAYEARVCNRDPGLNYRVNGVKFDGYDHPSGTLVDAKNYTDVRGTSRMLARNNRLVGERLLEDARRQLRAARGMKIEWRVSGKVAAGKIEELFRMNDIPIHVVYVP